MPSVWFKRAAVTHLKFFQVKDGGPGLLPEGFLQIVWIIWSPFCILILKVLRTQILYDSLDFNAFCLIQQYLSQSFEISAELKRRDQISGRGSAKSLNYLVFSSLWIAISIVLRKQIIRSSIDFNAFSMTEECFCQTFKVSKIKERGT